MKNFKCHCSAEYRGKLCTKSENKINLFFASNLNSSKIDQPCQKERKGVA